MSAQGSLVNHIIVERGSECPVTTAIAIIAGKWKPTILCEIRKGLRRFSDLRRDIPGISEKVLSQHLRDLEADGIVARREFHEGAVLRPSTGSQSTGAPSSRRSMRWANGGSNTKLPNGFKMFFSPASQWNAPTGR